MRVIRVETLLLVVTTLFAALPALAASAIAADITLPVVGNATGANGISYRTELMLTNHRDAAQYVELSFVHAGHDAAFYTFRIEPRRTKFLPGTIDNFDIVAALRIRTLADPAVGGGFDPNGKIEASAFIVAERGRFAVDGASRQEIAAIPSDEYDEEEAVFVGVRHSPNTGVYTNVGIVNMHPTQTETFYVEFQHQVTAVVVPPNSLRQIRIPGEGGGFRYVRVYPEWSVTDEAPARTTPWVAYASSVDTQTGDAFSGIRVPPGTQYDAPGPD